MGKIYLDQLMDLVLSLKFAIFAIASLFLHSGKITADNWVNIMLFLAGFHTASAVTSIVRGTNTIIPRTFVSARPDNPDVN